MPPVIRICGHLKDAALDLNAQLAALTRRPFGELACLPAWSAIDHANAGISFWRYRKLLPDGRVQIVVQAYRPGRRLLFVEIGQMAAEGVWVSPDGRIERIPQSALYDYT